MYLADGGGGGSVEGAKQVADLGASIGKNMANFAKAASAGAFEVSETGGKALIEAIEDFQNWIQDVSERTNRLTQERKLGGSVGAQTMKGFTQSVATDGEGFLTQLRALRDSLDKAKEGIQRAMDNYRATEEANEAALRKAGGSW